MSFEPPPQDAPSGLSLLINIALHHEPFEAILDPRAKALGAQLIPKAVARLSLDEAGPLQRSRAP